MRKYWPHFIQDTEVLVFVVDSTDRKRFPQAYNEMHKLLGEPRLEEKPVIVLANKQVNIIIQTIMYAYVFGYLASHVSLHQTEGYKSISLSL